MPDSSSNTSTGRSLLREVIIAAACLGLGALALPAAVFTVGTLLLGPYTGGLGKFYQGFFQDLVTGEPRTWSLVLGPYLVIMLLRAIFFRRRAPQAAEETSQRQDPRPEQVRTTTRVVPPQRPAPSVNNLSTQPTRTQPSQTRASQTRPSRPGSKRIEPSLD